MKRTLFILIILTLLAGTAGAADITGGAKLTAGDYNHVGDVYKQVFEITDESNKFSLSYGLGFFYNIQFNPYLGFQAELLFSSITLRTGSGSTWAQDQYFLFSAPVYYRVQFNFSTVGLYIMAGPRFDYFLDNASTLDSDGIEDSYSRKKWAYRNFIICASAAAGAVIPVDTGQLRLGMGYTRALSSEFTSNSKAWYQGFDIQVAYGLAL